MTKDFHLGDILSITTGRLVSPRHIGGVYDILNWMTGENLFTHQLGRVSKEAEPVLLAAMPWLQNADLSSEALDEAMAGAVDKEIAVKEWVTSLVAKYGEMHPVPKLNADEHERIDARSELAGMIHPDRIIEVQR